MNLYSLLQEQWLPISAQQAWEFFGNPSNLPLITSPDLGFKITSHVPERMYAGMIVTYTVTPFGGIPVKWITEITHADPPHFFVDEQRFGPYRFWHHQHHFRESAEGVEMTDLVHYILPFGPLGTLAAPLVRKRLESIFSFRRQVLSQRFATTHASP